MQKTAGKRLTSLLLALLVALMCVPGLELDTVSAATSYDLTIAGKQVNSDNAADILDNGVFSYDAATKTLLIKDDYTYDGTSNLISGAIDGMTIKTEKELTLDSGAATTIYVSRSATIQTGGLLTLISGKYGVYLGNSTENGDTVLTIKDSELDITGGQRGITGYGKKEKLSILYSNITASGSSGAVCTFENGIQLSGCKLISPEGALITKPEGKRSYSVYDASGTAAAKSVTIEGRYGLYVGGKQVTGGNSSNVLGDGKVSYDHDTKTLTLKGDVNTDSQYGILNESIQGLTVKVDKQLNLSGAVAGISSKCDMTITGAGLLSILGSNMTYGVYMYEDTTLTLNNANIFATADQSALYGAGSSCVLDVVHSSVSALTKSSEQSVIQGFGGGVTCDRCKVEAPKQAVIKGGTFYESDGRTKARSVVIEPIDTYKIYIGSVQVTELNAADVLGNGKVSFDLETNTLTLNNPTVSGTYSQDELSIYVQGLEDKITVKGKLNIPQGNAAFYNCRFVDFDLNCATVKGEFVQKSGNVTVDQIAYDCNITVDGTAFTANKLHSGRLTVNSGKVSVGELDAALTVNGGSFSGKVQNTTDDIIISGDTTTVNAQTISSEYGDITINGGVVRVSGNISAANGNITVNAGETVADGYVRAGKKLTVSGRVVRLEAESTDDEAAVSASSGNLSIGTASLKDGAVIQTPVNGKVARVGARSVVADASGNAAKHVVIAPSGIVKVDSFSLGDIAPAVGEKAKHAQDIGEPTIAGMSYSITWFIDENEDGTADELDEYSESYYLPSSGNFEDCTTYSALIQLDLRTNDKRVLSDNFRFLIQGMASVKTTVVDTPTGQHAQAVVTFEKKSHSLVAVAGKAATCKETGYKKYWECETCGKLFSDSVGDNQIKEPIVIPIDNSNHRYGEWSLTGFDVKKGTAIYTRVCSICSKAEARNVDGGVKRFAGSNRYATATEISKEISKSTYDRADTVVLAYGLNSADALAGVPLAAKLNAPILLTTTDMLPKDTLDEIIRLKAKNVVILGGEGAISQSVVDTLTANGIDKDNIKRLAGGTRYGTATAIAGELNSKPTEIFFVNGLQYADALSASSVAAIKNAPIVYLRASGEIDQDTKDYLESVKGTVKNAYVIGGSGVIDDNMMKAAGDALGLTVDETITRVAGANRYATCVAVNNTFENVFTSTSICVAKGLDFPDALAGGVFAALNKAPLLLADNRLQDVQIEYLQSKKSDSIYIFGGTAAVTDELADEIGKASI